MSSVADNLALFRGVWHDVVTAYAPDGTPLSHDEHGGTPGPMPYEQLVYLNFDGARFTQTNVVLSGRPAHTRTFGGSIVEGVLVFDALGPEAPEVIGVSGGPGVLVFLPRFIDHAAQRFHDPDYIRHLGGEQRTRTTTLYRAGEVVRVLTVWGTRISDDPTRRVPTDPRNSDDPQGSDGPVHNGTNVTRVYTEQPPRS